MKYQQNVTARLAMQDGNADSQEDCRLIAMRQSRILSNPKVKRKLFVDDEDSEGSEIKQGLNDNQTNELMEMTRKHREEMRKKYNFNFETEEPEPGNYIWEKVKNDEDESQKIRGTSHETEERIPSD